MGAVGLSSSEAARLRAEVGANELAAEPPTPTIRLVLSQLQSPLVLLLLAACAVSLALGDRVDAVAIGAIVVLNAVVGFLQESRAERALRALKDLSAPRATVVRDGHATTIPAADVVPGDRLVLSAGDLVAADARLLEAQELLLVESLLTGESIPVEKVAGAPAGPSLPERRGEVFRGTSVARGTGVAEVTATGMRTEMGRIAHLLLTADRGRTPLQERLAAVGRSLLALCLVVVGAVLVVGLLRGRALLEALISSVSLAVAAVPEGLPAIVTIALAVGVQRLAARNVLVRRLASVETLGSTTVICTDKTGTLTTGQMRVRDLWGPDRRRLLFAAAACNDAELSGSGQAAGDPTEVALLIAAAEHGVLRPDIERDLPRTHVHPFDSSTRMMSVERSDGTVYVKGALEAVLPLCRDGAAGAEEAARSMAEAGLRVLAFAQGPGGGARELADLGGLALLGLAGLADPPRTEAIEAAAQARRAGIRTVMITGDHPVTARAIALEMGLLAPGQDPSGVVYARASAEDKLKLVRDLKARGEIVAMTGDGVNDAPAIREAHIGIAMGRSGTEVTREASDMVLTDDDYASIVGAVREGRGIYENIRKTVVYLLTGNAAEIAVMLLASLAALPVPLLPLQLLWINLVTDGLPALALALDPPEDGLLERPPRRPDEPILGRRQWRRILTAGALEAAVVLGVFATALRSGSETSARSLAFTTLVLSELFRAFAARSDRKVLFAVGAFTNLKLVGVVALSAALQLALHEVPVLQRLFRIEPLSIERLLLAVGCALVTVTVLEVAKLLDRRP